MSETRREAAPIWFVDLSVDLDVDVQVDVDVDVDEWPDLALAHERLDVYRRAIEFLADQLRRASLSIHLNIAEGVGKANDADRRRYYQIARGSATECGAILDACRILRVSDDQSLDHGKRLLVRIVSMPSRLCR